MNWTVPWAPGTLTATAYKGGQPWASASVRTAAAPHRIALALVAPGAGVGLRADGRDAAIVAATVVDAAGNAVPSASNLVTVRAHLGTYAASAFSRVNLIFYV